MKTEAFERDRCGRAQPPRVFVGYGGGLFVFFPSRRWLRRSRAVADPHGGALDFNAFLKIAPTAGRGLRGKVSWAGALTAFSELLATNWTSCTIPSI